MDSIKNYRFRDFIKLDYQTITDYRVLLEHIPEVKTKRELFYMKLKHVEFIKTHLYDGEIESMVKIISKVQKIPKEDVYEIKIVELYGLINNLKSQLERILRGEETALRSKVPNMKWEAVGGSEKLQKFGIYNTLDKLSGGDITKYKEIMEISYADIFTKLYLDNTVEELQYEMNQIKLK